mmetsp:Transcript_25378/g.74519  ORF Transcript_25378/g.74519 Transcript_25378/m.74519 type:complete len:603 (-) Transcript_25378:98-1906(-)
MRPAEWLYRQMATVDGVQLLALRDGDNMLIFKGDVQVQPHMLGMWMARSERALSALVTSTEAPLPDMVLARAVDSVADSVREARARGEGAAAPCGSLATQLSAAGRRDSAPVANRVVVCGWPQDVDKLVTILLSRAVAHPLSVAHIAQASFSAGADASPSMRRFNNTAYRGRYTFVEGDPLDREVLKQHILAPGLHSVIIFHSHLREHGDRMDAIVCAAKVESMLPPGHQVRVNVNLSSTADMRFVERSSWWPSDDDVVVGHLTSPTYASGAVIADEMLYPLMMGWAKEGLIEFCTRLADNLLDPVQLELFELPPELAERAQQVSVNQRAATRSHKRGARASSPARAYANGGHSTAAPRPSLARGSMLTYEELKMEFLARGRLCMGLYRQRQDIGSEKLLRALPFVYANPVNRTHIRSTDRVFALTTGRAAVSSLSSTSSKAVLRAVRRIQRSFRDYRESKWLAQASQAQGTVWESIPSGVDFDRAPSVRSEETEAQRQGLTAEELREVIDERLDSRLAPLEDKVEQLLDEIGHLSQQLAASRGPYRHMHMPPPSSRKGTPASAATAPHLAPPPSLAPPRFLSVSDRDESRDSDYFRAGAAR